MVCEGLEGGLEVRKTGVQCANVRTVDLPSSVRTTVKDQKGETKRTLYTEKKQ